MNFLRRGSRQNSGLSDDDLRALRQQRRKSSIAIAHTFSHEEPVFTQPIKPPIDIFPFSTVNQQQTLIISPDPGNRNYIIMRASNAEQFLSVTTPTLSLPAAQSHAKQFYGRLPKHLEKLSVKRKDSNPKDKRDSSNNDNSAKSNGNGGSGAGHQCDADDTEGATCSEHPDECPVTKLFTLERDTLSIRRRHHVSDPYSGKKLLQIEFSASSSWDSHALKANIELLNRYSKNVAVEPVRLRWLGKKNSLEGVLDVVTHGKSDGKPVAVCAKGEETASSGDYILYVAPGMDACVAVCVVMAVEDRTRRGSDEFHGPPMTVANGTKTANEEEEEEDHNVAWTEGYK